MACLRMRVAARTTAGKRTSAPLSAAAVTKHTKQ